MSSRMELMRQAGNEPALVGLVRVYKDYYPDVIVGDAVAGRASVFVVLKKAVISSNCRLISYSIQTLNGGNTQQRFRRETCAKHTITRTFKNMPSG